MSEIKFEKKGKPDELIRAQQLINEGKLDEALQITKNFEEKGDYTSQDKILCQLLKSKIFCNQGLYENAVKLTEQIYKESLGLGKNLLTVDVLLIMAYSLLNIGRLDKAQDIMKQGEVLTLANKTVL